MESEKPMISDTETPHEALEAVHRSRRAIAERLQYPRWFEVAYPLGAGVLIGAIALPDPASAITSSLLAVLLCLAYRHLSERTGVSMSGIGPGRARWAMLALGAVLIVLAGASFVLTERVVWWGPLPLAPVAALSAHVAFRQWLRMYRAEFGGRP